MEVNGGVVSLSWLIQPFKTVREPGLKRKSPPCNQGGEWLVLGNSQSFSNSDGPG